MKVTKNKKIWELLNFLCGLFLLSGFVYGAEQKTLDPYDFYQGVQLSSNSYHKPFVWLELPAEAYINSAYSNTLQDVRIFNGTGQEIPSALFFDAEETSENSLEKFSFQRLVSRVEQNHLDDNNSYVDRQYLLVEAIPNKVTQIELPFTKFTEKTAHQAYLLTRQKNGASSFPINTLYLDWVSHTEDWQAKVFIYASEDKQNWVTLASNQPVMSLNSAAGIVRTNAIELLTGNDTALSAPYLMIVILGVENTFPDLTNVEASVKIQHSTRRQETLNFVTNNEGMSLNQLIYRLPSSQPLTEIVLQLQQDNRVLPLRIEYTADSGEDWLPLTNIVAYSQVNNGNNVVRNPPLILNGKAIKKLRVTALKGSWDDKPPVIEGKRDAVNIIFNIQGPSPYLLVWGSYNANVENMSYQQLIGQSLSVDEVMKTYPEIDTSNNILNLGGEEQLTSDNFVDDDYDWMVIMLWILLSIGIIALFYFGWYLSKEINSKS